MSASNGFSSADLDRLLQAVAERFQREYNDHDAPRPGERWDAVVITACDAVQAKTYERQLAERRAAGLLPQGTDFLVVPDRGGERVGSGGSTLSVLRALKVRYGGFAGKKFLCLHAGGSSQRCPNYSVSGKLFCPIPCAIRGRAATLFDWLLFTVSAVPRRMDGGLLVMSGDILLLFDPAAFDLTGCDAAIVTVKETAEVCSRHGVCVADPQTGCVKAFLHKLPVAALRQAGAVDASGRCDIDTGAVFLGEKAAERLCAAAETQTDYHALVNGRVRLSLYGDINYVLSEDATPAGLQRQQPEGEFCPELTAARNRLWAAVGDVCAKQLSLDPAVFLHFGSLPEVLRLFREGARQYPLPGWSSRIGCSFADEEVSGYNAVLEPAACVGADCYLENARVRGGASVGRGCIVSDVEVGGGTVIPNRVLVHGLRQNNGAFVCRILGLDDDPKSKKLFGRDLEQTAGALGLNSAELWNEAEAHTLWNARLYPECASMGEALAEALTVYQIITGQDRSLVSAWLARPRRSLSSAAQAADAAAAADWNHYMEDLVKLEQVKQLVRAGRPASEAAAILGRQPLTARQRALLRDALNELDLKKPNDFSFALRLLYYVGAGAADKALLARAFELLAEAVRNTPFNTQAYHDQKRIAADEVCVQLPLRVNWGGTWSDACPYCLEHGGAILNAAVTLDGDYPVKVRVKKTREPVVAFVSGDMQISRAFDSLEQLWQTGDPYDPFALQKACLLACGMIPGKGEAGGVSLREMLTRLGGGFEIFTEVTGIPQGSGLGTSSILSAAVVKALREFTAEACPDETLFAAVLAIEQIMSTGGGWQDQVGGAAPGLKFSTSEPGFEQHIRVERLCLSEATKAELSERFALIYTGQKRLAKNLLREVVGRYIANEPESLLAHDAIKKSAALMRAALEAGDVDAFAALMERNWSFNSALSVNMSNAATERLLNAVADLICAKYWCGAGGGGFLQVILKRGVPREALEQRLAAGGFPEASLRACQLLF